MVDTIRTIAEFQALLHPNIKNAMPDATVLQSQTARDLLVSIPYLAAGIYVASNEADIQTAINAASAAGGGVVVVPGGLGAIPVTSGIGAKSNVWLNILPGSYLSITGSNTINVLYYLGASASAGVAFTGTVTEFTDVGTLSAGTEGCSIDDIGFVSRGAAWQYLKVSNIVGSTFKFYDTFAWSFTTGWTFKRLINPLTRFKFSGEIRNTSNTGANSLAMNIQGFNDLDIIDAKITGFNGGASQIGIYLNGGYDLTIHDLHMTLCGNYNNTCAVTIVAVSKFAINNIFIDNLTAQPMQFAECVDGSLSNFNLTGGGRALEIDTWRRGFISDGIIDGNNATADDCMAVESQVVGFGAQFNSAYLYFNRVQGYNAAGFGLNLFGDGSGPNYYTGCVFLGNNTFDINASPGDLATYFRDMEYSTLQPGNVNLYITHPKSNPFTPGVTQSGAVTITWNVAEYTYRENVVKVVLQGSVTGGAGVGNNVILVGLPTGTIAAYKSFPPVIGTGFIYDASTGFIYPGIVQIAAGADSVALIPSAVAGAAPTSLGQTGSGFNAALAINDVISMSFEYRRV